MSSGQLGIAQTQPQTLDFTSSARNEEQCVMRAKHASRLQNLLIRGSDGQKASGDPSNQLILHTKR